jgi:hypothetical protein
MVGTTWSQGGVLVVVLILKPWEGVDEGNKMIMPSTWLCLLVKAIRLALKPNVISRYHPQPSGE